MVSRALLPIAVFLCALNASAQTGGSLADYVFTPPQGWSVAPYPDGITITAPVSTTGERCLIQLWPMRAASEDLQRHAQRIFGEVFQAFEPRASDYATPSTMSRGVSAQGWEYFIFRHPIGLPGNPTVFGFVFLAKLEGRLAPVSGISKDPLVSACFGQMVNDVWPKFFYGLQFRSWKPRGESAQLAQKIAGTWTAASATAADRIVFAGNGRYASAAAAQRYVRISSTELLRITDAYFGDGGWSLTGHQVAFTPDAKTRPPEAGWLRVEQESRDGGTSWRDKLYLLRRSATDGREYEVLYTRD